MIAPRMYMLSARFVERRCLEPNANVVYQSCQALWRPLRRRPLASPAGQLTKIRHLLMLKLVVQRHFFLCHTEVADISLFCIRCRPRIVKPTSRLLLFVAGCITLVGVITSKPVATPPSCLFDLARHRCSVGLVASCARCRPSQDAGYDHICNTWLQRPDSGHCGN